MKTEATPTNDPAVVLLHSGRRLKMIYNRICCRKVSVGAQSKILVIPESAKAALARFGHHQAGSPVAAGEVLAVGPDCKQIKVGDFVLIDPMNTNEIKIDGRSYYLPLEAVLAEKRLDKSGKKKWFGATRGKALGSAILLIADNMPE